MLVVGNLVAERHVVLVFAHGFSGGPSVTKLPLPATWGSEENPLEAVSLANPGNGLDDDEIAAAIHSGEFRRALVGCAHRYGSRLGRLCMAMLGSQADADDVVQETLLAAHDGFSSWRAEGSLESWLFAIARRKCARLLEQRARRTARLRLVHADRPLDGGAEGEVHVRQRAERARAALEELRPTEREALLLRFGAGLGYADVASVCGVDEAAARKRVSRGLAALRAVVDADGRNS